MIRYISILILFLTCNLSFAQDEVSAKNNTLVQISGVVVSSDSLAPVPFVNIYDKKTRRGSFSDYYGYFSFVAHPGDTIVFSSVGFKKSEFFIPDTLKQDHYSMIQIIEEDTIALRKVEVWPWPSREEFEDAFVNLELPNDDLIRAKENLSSDNLAFLASRLPSSPSMGYKWTVQQQNSKLYYMGQAPTIQLLNPIAWSKFIKAWKSGKFTNKDKK